MRREVALRKESVDRNVLKASQTWRKRVALRKESVDRNICSSSNVVCQNRRSPQGERG